MIDLHFHHLHIVLATATAIFNMHAAFAAFIATGISQLNGINLVHAVMNRNHKACADSEVNEEQYGSEELFHLPCKYRQ